MVNPAYSRLFFYQVGQTISYVVFVMVILAASTSLVRASPQIDSNESSYDSVIGNLLDHLEEGRLNIGPDFGDNLSEYFVQLREMFCDYDSEEKWWDCDVEFEMYNCSDLDEDWVIDADDCQEIFDDENIAESVDELVDEIPPGVDIVIKNGSGSIDFYMLFTGIMLCMIRKRIKGR